LFVKGHSISLGWPFLFNSETHLSKIEGRYR
jgi:hypothetical protein